MLAKLAGLVKKTVLAGTLVGGGTCFIVLYNVGNSKWSDSHTWSSATRHYLTNKFMVCLGFVSFRQLVKQSRDIRGTQQLLLLDNIKKNAETEYGRDHKFGNISSIGDFRQLHPLTTYPHYKAYIEKIKSGDLLAMTCEPPQQLAVTSGTSGESSLLPTTNHIFTRFFLSGIALLFQRLNDVHPEWTTLQRSMKLFYTPRWRYTESGLRMGPNSSNPDTAKRIYHLYSTPPPAYGIKSEPEALYIHLLFGLTDRNLGVIESNFASTVYTGFKAMEADWRQLVEDIEEGRINPDLNIPQEIRTELEAGMQPNPSRADELRKEFSAGFDNIAKRIWPNLNLILCTTTGSMAIYHTSLKNKYCQDIPTYSPIYGASEGLLGVNLFPDQESPVYCLIPDAQFFEFIKVEDAQKEDPETLLLHELSAGSVYEVVVTNGSGLYRYRMGDVVQVCEYFNEIPVVKFMYRRGQMLNVHGEKISEQIFFSSLQKAEKEWNISLRDYTTAESVLDDKGSAVPHYDVFIEPEVQDDRDSSVDLDLSVLDRCLQTDHPVYQSFRLKGSIGEMNVVQVKPGTFEKLRQLILSTSLASNNQFKVPRVLKKKEHVEFLLQNKQ